MNPTSELEPALLRTLCDSAQFTFESTADLVDIDVTVGQARALESLRFGLRMRGAGYNVFALGPPGIGKLSAARQMVEQEARKGAAPPDWCYVYNFAEPHKPNVIRLPAGVGANLRADMARFVEELQAALPAAFESEDFRTRIEGVNQTFKERQQQMVEQIGEQAREHKLSLIHTEAGFAFAPLKNEDEVFGHEEYARLPETERKLIEADILMMQQQMQKSLRQAPQWAKEVREQVKSISREITEAAVGNLIEVLSETYAELDELADYLAAISADIIDNVDAFLPQHGQNPGAITVQTQQSQALQRYHVNLLVDNSMREHAPVVFEDLPSYANLIGRTEYQAQMGALVTDFTLIKSGALHRANGGYLVLDAHQLLMQPLAWDGLKRALQAREIRLDSLERSLSLISTVSLEPEHIPLDVKVVLMGDRRLYYMLSQFDPEFADLFKVMADFNDVMDRGAATNKLYASLFGTLSRQHKLRPLNPQAVARMIEHAARLAEDAEKISTHLGGLTDLLREADHWAGEASCETIDAAHVQCAIDQLVYRGERVREHQYENIQRGTILIDTDGVKVGQVNGLSVLELGQFRFGQPTRITATTRLGDGRVIDIERETHLGGPIHSKGVLILSGFLASRYAENFPLSMSASIVFEQSYGMIEGDSASLAELCALLSSLSRIPIFQRFALTGSVNQHGEVQPIGGVNEKIEGFFDICRNRELTTEQGVLIPLSNVKHLMLREDVVQAVRERKFHIHAVATVDQAIALLTGEDAGVGKVGGKFGVNTVNGKVSARLVEFMAMRSKFSTAGARNKRGR